MYYGFYDTNYFGDQSEERSYDKEDYKVLLTHCFKYCDTLSLKMTSDSINNEKKFEKYRIPKPDCIVGSPKGVALAEYDKYITVFDGDKRVSKKVEDQLRFYHLCPELLELMFDTADDMFEWLCGWGLNNPEDPAFYRNDGSAFFESIIHEGEFYIYPKAGEDVSKIINNKPWYCFDDDMENPK